MNLIEAIAAQRWAITEDGLRTICAIAEREGLSFEAVLAKRPDLAITEAIATRSGEWLEDSYDVEIRDGVAIINVRGPLFRYANLFSRISGATSYELLAKDFSLARQSDAVKAILLNVDSPGGMVNGCAELADLVFAARGEKPIIAYSGGSCASGAYWLGSAADEIVVAETALVGSIGVILSTTDTRERDAKAGVKTIEIVSSLSPHKTADLSTDEGRARIQQIVDDQAEIFVAAVSRNRGVDRATVLEKFGRGGVMVGARAVEAGLADRLGSFEGVLAELVKRTSDQPSGLAGGFISFGAQTDMSTATPTAAAPAPTPAPAPAATAPAITAEHIAANYPAIAAHFRAEGATAENTRIAALEALAEAGDEDILAAAKKDTTVTAERFAVQKVEKSKAQKAGALAAVKGDEATITAPAPSSAPAPDNADTVAQEIAALAGFGKK